MNSLLQKDGKSRITVKELVTMSLLAAVMVAGQVVMSPIANVEPVSLLIITCAIVYGWKAFYPVYVFIFAEGLLYGLGIWFVNYLYVWSVLTLLAVLLRRMEGRVLWASVSGLFGLCFGALCALPYFFIGGWRAAFSYWVSGLLFDVVHAAGNFIIALLFLPICVKLVRKLGKSD